MLYTFSRSTAVIFCLIFLLKVGIAQQIENLVFRLEETNIIINYDLVGQAEESYFITVFSSHNGFSDPIQFVTGDVGENISPGTGKTVTWDARQELGDFKGNLSVRIRARLVPIISFENIPPGLRRGKVNEIKWQPGTSQENIKFELYKGNELVNDLGQIPNIGAWNWNIPKNQKMGKGFRFKAIVLNKSAYSAEFRISPKIPMLLKILPIAGVLGGLVAVLAGGGKDAPVDNAIVLPLLPN